MGKDGLRWASLEGRLIGQRWVIYLVGWCACACRSRGGCGWV